MKSLINYFIKYPVSVNVLMIAIALFGLRGLSVTKSSFFPLADPDLITIQTVYPGASPAEMEEGIVLKIEDNLRGMSGVKEFTSASRENSATITVQAVLGYDIDVLLADVKNAVDLVPSFPGDMEPPIIAKQEPRSNVIGFAVNGENVPLKTLKQIARQIEDDLRSVKGISQVTLTGFPSEEIEIAVRENDLRAFDLTFDEVARAVASANLLTTGGNIKTETEEYLIRANNRSYYGDEMGNIVVRSDLAGKTIYLKDVAAIRDRFSENPDRIYFNGKPAVQISLDATNQEDLMLIAEYIREYIAVFNADNTTVQLNVTNDRSISLQQRTDLLVDNGTIGILLVLLFLSLFLKPSIAFWVAIGLPISFLGLFIFAPSFMTINVISLFGMILVIGILVDDGIVIGENIFSHYQKGKSPIQAATDGTNEVVAPIVSAILTTIVAFSTFYFLPGRLGTFFGEIAFVITIILLISLVEALIILPSHLAHSRAMKKGVQSFWFNEQANRGIEFLRDRVYAPALRFVLQNKFLGFAIPIGLLALTIGAIGGGIIRTSFFPPISSNRVQIDLKMPQGTSENITDSLITMMEVAAWAANDSMTNLQGGDKPIVENIVRRIGPGAANGDIVLNLLAAEERDFSASEVANAVRERVGEVYGAESVIFGSGNVFGGSPISVSLISSNIDEIKAAKAEIKEQLRQMTDLKDISDTDPAGIKEIKIELKENAYLLGLTLNDVMSQVRSGFFGRSVQRFQRGRDEIRVWVRYDEFNRRSINDLDEMWIVTRTRERVPFAEIATYSIERGEVVINHREGQREILVNAGLKDPKASAPDILESVKANIVNPVLAKYPSVRANYEGQSRQGAEIGEAFGNILPVILFLIYAIIAFTFRSYSQPLLLFALIPFSLIGVAWGHYIHDANISLLSLLGIVALIGILVNDGLVLIGKFNSLLKEGLQFQDALYEAGKARFRAIFLTSLTTIAGLAPLIFEKSFSAQFLIPMAISVAYGIAMATFLTLFLLPLLLSMVNYSKVGWNWFKTGKRPTRESVERAVTEDLE